MECAFLGQGTRGDLYPLLGVARSLVERGHRVQVFEYDEYESDVSEAGLNFVRVGRGSQCRDVFANTSVRPATRSSEWATDRLYAQASLRSARSFVDAVAAAERQVDAIIAPACHIGAQLSSESAEVPLVSTYVGTAVLEAFDSRSPSGWRSPVDQRRARLVDRFMVPRIAEIRREIGLGSAADDQSFARHDRVGGLVFGVGPLSAVRSVPPTFDVVGYPNYYGPDLGLSHVEVEDFLTESEELTVVCTLGDGWARALPKQLVRLVDHANRGRCHLLVVGSRVCGATDGRGVKVVSQVNLHDVLGYADVCVHHGGMGTLVAALRNAVPSVMMTQWPDGRRNAAMLASRGLGVDLGSEPPAERVVEAIDATAHDAEMHERLRAVRSAMRADRDPVAALLDRLDGTGGGVALPTPKSAVRS